MKRAWKLVLGCCTVGYLVASAGSAAAANGPPVHLLLRDCPEIRESEVERVVAAELGTDTGPNDDAPDPTWIIGTCENQRVLIEVTDAVSRKTLRRSFLLSGAAPAARGRLIGIAAAELVLASWSELALRPPLRVKPEGTPASAERARAASDRARDTAPARPPAPARTIAPQLEASEGDEIRTPKRLPLFALQPSDQRRFRLMPTGSGRVFLRHPGALWGGGFRVGEEPLVNTSWSLDTLYESGRISTNNGRFKIDTWTAGALLYLYGRVGIFTARAGAGLRAGFAVSRAESGESTSVVLPWGWPMCALSFSLGARGTQLELSGEAGYVSLPVAPSSVGLSITGLWAAAQVGFGFSP